MAGATNLRLMHGQPARAVEPTLGPAVLHKPMHLSSAFKPCSATFLQLRAGTVLVGYMRVSTSEQNLALQRDALAGAGCDRFYEDTCSGSVAERPAPVRP